jgi:hypothetical protein
MAQRALSVEPAFATFKRPMHGGEFLLEGNARAITEINFTPWPST